MQLPDSARALIESGAHAHLVTLNPDGSPQVTLVWAGIEGKDLVTAHLFETKKRGCLKGQPLLVWNHTGILRAAPTRRGRG